LIQNPRIWHVTGAEAGAPGPHITAYPISAPAQPNRPPTSADVVEKLCDEFTRRLQDAITLGVKRLGCAATPWTGAKNELTGLD
jgi:hypothetical protein